MATVKTLADFYKSQNALAVEAAGQTASLEAARQRNRASISSNEKMEQQRLRQTEQLERMKQKMDLQRENRGLDFEARKFTAEQLASDARAKLSREAASKESELDRLSRMAIESFQEEGRMRRQEMGIEAARPTQADLRKQAADVSKAESQAEKARLDVAAFPISQKEKLVQTLGRIQDNLTTKYDELSEAGKWFGGDKETAKRLKEEIAILESAQGGILGDLQRANESLDGDTGYLAKQVQVGKAKEKYHVEVTIPTIKRELDVAKARKATKWLELAETAMATRPDLNPQVVLANAYKRAKGEVNITEDEFRALWQERQLEG